MGHTDFLDHQEQGTPARHAFHHRVRLLDTCGKHAWTEAAADGGPLAHWHSPRTQVGQGAWQLDSSLAKGAVDAFIQICRSCNDSGSHFNHQRFKPAGVLQDPWFQFTRRASRLVHHQHATGDIFNRNCLDPRIREDQCHSPNRSTVHSSPQQQKA